MVTLAGAFWVLDKAIPVGREIFIGGKTINCRKLGPFGLLGGRSQGDEARCRDLNFCAMPRLYALRAAATPPIALALWIVRYSWQALSERRSVCLKLQNIRLRKNNSMHSTCAICRMVNGESGRQISNQGVESKENDADDNVMMINWAWEL